MKTIVQFMQRSMITLGRNVRLLQRMAIDEMASDLGENGMNVKPTGVRSGKKIEIVQGHRRILGSDRLKVTDPALYKKWFGKGIEIEILEDITYEAAQLLKVDQGNTQPLSGYELQLCANMLFDYGLTEKSVTTKLAGMLDRLVPMKAKAKKTLEGFNLDLALMIEKGDSKKIKGLTAKIDEYVFGYRRGLIQGLHNAYRCPEIVLAALYKKDTGDLPEGFDKSTILPEYITTAEIAKMWKAFKEDLDAVDEGGVRKYSKAVPGPLFNAEWSGVLKTSDDKVKNREDGASRSKAKSGKEMKEEAKEKWTSTGFQLLTLSHAGDTVDMAKTKQHDGILYLAELVQERDPAAWKEVVKLAKGLEKLAVAERAELDAKEAASK